MTNDAFEAEKIVERAVAAGWRTWTFLIREREEDLAREQERTAKLIDVGHELLAWDGVEQSRNSLAPPEVSAAIATIAKTNAPRLAEILGSAKDCRTAAVLAPQVRTEADFHVALELVQGKSSIAALMFLRSLRWICGVNPRGRGAADFQTQTKIAAAKLSELGAASAKRPRHEEISLWWQAVSLGPRLGGVMTERFPPAVGAMYGQAAEQLARDNGDWVLPTAERAAQWRSTNDAVMAILPYVAQRLEKKEQRHLLSAFFADVDRAIQSEQPYIVRISGPSGWFYLEAAAYAIFLEVQLSNDPGWFEHTVCALIDAASGWEASGGTEEIDRPAWVVSAAALACAIAADRKEISAATRLAKHVAEISLVHLCNWSWRMRGDGELRRSLPQLVARTAAFLPMDEARGVLLCAIEAASDARSIETIQTQLAPDLRAETILAVQRALETRQKYERDLNIET